MNRSRPLSTAVSARRRPGGFTLVELLVGLALFALISILLAGGLRFGIRAWEVGRERAEPTDEVGLAQNLLRRELGEAALQRDDRDASTFAGGPDSVAFAAPLPAAAMAGESYAFLLQASAVAERTDLALAWKPATAASRPGEGDVGSAVLLEDIAGIELAYFGATAPGRAPVWSSRWNGVAGLPQLIRLRVRFPAGDRRLWPDLFVAPRYEAPQ